MEKLCSEMLQKLKGKTLSTAESCTGGMIGQTVTSISGCSSVYRGGFITYCNEAKQELLNVPRELLDSFGAVSHQVAQVMAIGARRRFGSDISVSVTGLAGPGSDGSSYPVGTVFIGYSDDKGTISRCFHFSGDRHSIRQQATREALLLIMEKQ